MKVFEKLSEDQRKQVNTSWASSVFYLLLPACFLSFHLLRSAIPPAAHTPADLQPRRPPTPCTQQRDRGLPSSASASASAGNLPRKDTLAPVSASR